MDKKLNGWNDNKSPSSGIGGRPPYVERVAQKNETPDQPEPLCPHLDKNLKCKNMCLTRCVEGNRFWKEDGAVTEPLPESFEKYMGEARDEFVLAIKNVERSNYLLTAVDSFLICFDQMRDRLAAASTISEPKDAISFVEWFASDNNPYPDKYSSDDDNDGKWHDAFSEGINRHYYTTEQLYKIYRKQ